MVLIKLPGPNEITILVDCYFVEETTETTHTTIDDFYKHLPEDSNGRPYVDVFMLTHPDDDHCHGAKDVLHLAAPDKYIDKPSAGNRKKIFVREIWSAPMVFRRKGKDETLTDDAREIKKEAKRRVAEFKKSGADDVSEIQDGDRVLILGQDQKEDGNDRLEGLGTIHKDLGDSIVMTDSSVRRMEAFVRGPLPPEESEEDEDLLSSNRSSIILQPRIYVDGKEANILLLGGDAGVTIWRRLNEKYSDKDALKYDLLLAPHHCSWGVLSEEPATDKDAKVDPDAKEALSQTDGGYVVVSSKPIKDNDDNPPSHRAKEEYIKIVDNDRDRFKCTGEEPDTDAPEPLTFKFTSQGPQPPTDNSTGKSGKAMLAGLATTEREHG